MLEYSHFINYKTLRIYLRAVPELFVERLHVGEDALPIRPVAHHDHVIHLQQRENTVVPEIWCMISPFKV